MVYCAFCWYCSTDVRTQAARVRWQIPEQALPMFAAIASGTTSAEDSIRKTHRSAMARTALKFPSPDTQEKGVLKAMHEFVR